MGAADFTGKLVKFLIRDIGFCLLRMIPVSNNSEHSSRPVSRTK